jgi:hypothetical protein
VGRAASWSLLRSVLKKCISERTIRFPEKTAPERERKISHILPFYHIPAQHCRLNFFCIRNVIAPFLCMLRGAYIEMHIVFYN